MRKGTSVSRPKCKRDTCNKTAAAANHGYCAVHAEAYGVENPNIDALAATQQVAHLLTNGWTMHRIATESGVSTWSVAALARGESNHVRKRTHQRLHALPDTPPEPIPLWRVQRRLRSLQAAGWSQYRIAEHIGVHQGTVSNLVRGHHNAVLEKAALRIIAFYQQHHTDPVKSPTTAAKRAGWVPPLWWDDIDDPNEIPGVSH